MAAAKESKLPTEEALNELGEAGWELAGVLHAETHVIYYFKWFAR